MSGGASEGPLRLRLNLGAKRAPEPLGDSQTDGTPSKRRSSQRATDGPPGGLVSGRELRRLTIKVRPSDSLQPQSETLHKMPDMASAPLQPLMSALAAPVHVASGPKKRGRKKILNPDGTFKYPPRNRPSDILRRRQAAANRAAAQAAGLGAASPPPPAAVQPRPHPLSAMAGLIVEREKERVFRAALTDVLNPLWPRVSRPDTATSFESWEDAVARVLPFWLVLGPVRDAPRSEAMASDAESLSRTARAEIERIRGRLHAQLDAERRKPVAAELLVLEQRLCLEEEKVLCARLKAEYTQRVAEYLREREDD